MDDLELALPTGALIAGDAATVFADARPCLRNLPRGAFPVHVAADRLDVQLAEAEPSSWTGRQIRPTPSGYAALLDAGALAQYTDLGDEPVDEFELLAERLAEAPAAVKPAVLWRGVLGVRTDAAECVLELALDRDGSPCRLALRWPRTPGTAGEPAAPR